ncbi:MAG: aminotransferase class I/II-fold pyridoxal phosphate-dependent enzyme [Bacillota bacterium]|nr:aminotransferase class I/II-fold pyridoxal phosphate-dependent enzyme [Bacillota bacterium]
MIDYTAVQSARLAAIEQLGIGKFFDVPEGVISLGLGEPDFATPKKARAGGIAAIQNGLTSYPASEGLQELREETAKYLHERFRFDYTADEVLITVGGAEGFDSAIRALIEPGDEVIMPDPAFSCYEPIIQLAGGVAVKVPTYFEEDFKMKPERVAAAITPRTKMILLSFPNNPTGADMDSAGYTAIADIIRDTNILVLSDEIYSEMSYKEEHDSIIHYPGMRERSIYLSGFSKAYAMTGWRLGYVCAPRQLLDPIIKVHQFAVMCASGIAQYAALEGLRACGEDVRDMVHEYKERGEFVIRRLQQIGMPCMPPSGAFYVFPSIRETGLGSEEFCDRLMDEGKVAVVPGTAFGAGGEGFVRISYAYDIHLLEQALDRIEAFMAKLRSESRRAAI